MKSILLKPIILDIDLDNREGDYFPESHYNTIITNDADVYGLNDNGDKILIFKFRKNIIPNDLCIAAYNALESHAKKRNYNRGAASGKLNITKLPKYAKTIKNRQSFRAYYTDKNGKEKKDHISNMAQSNIAGYYDKPDRNQINPQTMCRTTKFTSKEIEKWSNTLPLLVKCDKIFKSLVPESHKRQLSRASLTPKYQIANTAFSTITLNYNWRTACHKDKGDYSDGFGNLIVLEKGKYSGGYLGFPKWGIAVDVRQGDFLAMDVHQWHCNTEISGMGDYGRLSIVCYLRENMIKCATLG